MASQKKASAEYYAKSGEKKTSTRGYLGGKNVRYTPKAAVLLKIFTAVIGEPVPHQRTESRLQDDRKEGEHCGSFIGVFFVVKRRDGIFANPIRQSRAR